MVKEEVKRVLFFWSVILIVSLLSFLALTGGKAGEKEMFVTRFVVYMSLLGVLGVFITIDYLTRNRKYLSWFGSYLHNENDSIIEIKWLKEKLFSSQKRLILLSTYLFYFLGIASVQLNIFFVGTLGLVTGQVLEIADWFLSAEPVALVETLILCILMGTWRNLSKKLTDNKGIQFFLLLVGVVVIGLFFGFVFHNLVYGDDQFSKLGSTSIGMSSCLLMIITGSIYPAWLFHSFNNFFFHLNQLYSNELIIITSGLIFAIWFFLSLFFIWRDKKKQ